MVGLVKRAFGVPHRATDKFLPVAFLIALARAAEDVHQHWAQSFSFQFTFPHPTATWVARMPMEQIGQQLPAVPTSEGLPGANQQRAPGRIEGKRTAIRAAGPVLEGCEPPVLIPMPPLIARLPNSPEASAELGPVPRVPGGS